ncbi:hypothetical protein ACHAXM_009228 [Skeletonema potamos]|jgi:hypothetical protein
MAAQAAFDPFADDWDEQYYEATPPLPPLPPRLLRLSRHYPEIENDALMSKPSNIQKRQTSVGSVIDFNDVFPSATLYDTGSFMDVESAGRGAKKLEDIGSALESDECKNGSDNIPADRSRDGLDGVVFKVHEQMSVIHMSQTKQCTLKVCGTVSVELNESQQHKQCRLHFDDPNRHIDRIASNGSDYAQTDNPLFDVIMPAESNTQLLEYTCSEKLCPVPMLVKTSVQDCGDYSKFLLQLMVNPRNTSPLVNAAVIISVPFSYAGERSCVSSVGRSIGRGIIDSNWSGVTRLLSWKLGELHSGAICEFEAVFPSSSDDDDDMDDISTETMQYGASKFPVLLRYDSDGSLLSGVEINCGRVAGHSFRKGFSVYHREI